MTPKTTLLLAEEPGIVTATIHRPDKLNALNAEVLRELRELVEELEARPAPTRARVLILTGSGERAFVAGADVSEMAELPVNDALTLSEAGHRLALALEGASFPVIAAVNGFALGGGCELALACDLILAAEKARFGQPEVGLGLIPGFGGTLRLAERVGIGQARRLLFTGEVIDAARALELGLADAVFPREKLLEEARALAIAIAARAPLAVATCKRVLGRGLDADRAVHAELEARAFAALFATRDAREGMRAFLDKRPASFDGT